LLGLLSACGEGDLCAAAEAAGVGVDELLAWAGRAKTERLAERLDRFQRLLTRLLVTAACMRASSRLAMRHDARGVGDGDGAEDGVVVADKLDLDIVKGLLPKLAEADEAADAAGVEGAGVSADDGVGLGVPREVDFEALRIALEALGDAGDDVDSVGGA
jgi:hypothetical protein